MFHTRWTHIKRLDDFAVVTEDQRVVLVHLPRFGPKLGERDRKRLTLVMRQFPAHFVEFDVASGVFDELRREYQEEGVILDDQIDADRDFFALVRARDLMLDEPRFVPAEVVYVDEFFHPEGETPPWETLSPEARAAIEAARETFRRFEETNRAQEPKLLRKWLLSWLRPEEAAAKPPSSIDEPQPRTGRLTGKSVFLSYARQDEAVAERLRDDLKNEGATVFLFSVSATLGVPVWEEIYEKIDQSEIFLLLASRHLGKSGGVRVEVSRAHFRSSKNEAPRRLISLILEKRVKLPKLLEDRNALPFQDYDEGLERLLRNLAEEPEPESPLNGKRGKAVSRWWLWFIPALALGATVVLWMLG